MSDENKDVMQEENQNILELVDEDGNTVPFEHLDTVQIDGEDYIVCIPYNEEEEEVTEIVLFYKAAFCYSNKFDIYNPGLLVPCNCSSASLRYSSER